ncbi:MAG: uroporphyrinogen-III C-methyltransferase [Gammaproteobacteria bacterium]
MKISRIINQWAKKWFYFSFLLSLVAFVVVGYSLWHIWHQSIEQQQQQIKQDNALLALEGATAHLEAQQKQLSASIAHLEQLAYWKNRDWVLSEVHYLLDLANLSLQFQHKVPAAIQLLTAADNRLRLVGDTNLLPLRKAIMTDKQQLQSATMVDVPGLLMKIQVMSETVSQLPLLPAANVVSSEPMNVEKATTHGWRDALQKTGEQLKQLVVIEKQSNLPKGALEPIQHVYNNIYLQALLTQLQWAVLQRDDTFYQDTIARMQRYILAHYLQQTPAIGVLKKNLKDIANEHLNPTQQHIKASLAALNDAMKLGSSYYD